jgi:hypothetical protein
MCSICSLRNEKGGRVCTEESVLGEVVEPRIDLQADVPCAALPL